MQKPFKLITDLNRQSNKAHPVRSFKSERSAWVAAARYLNTFYDGRPDAVQPCVEIVGPGTYIELTTSRESMVVVKQLHRDLGEAKGVVANA